MKLKQIKSATTKDLLDYFNKHSDKPVKRFSDRKAAERRVIALVKANKGASFLMDEQPTSPTPAKDRPAPAKKAPESKGGMRRGRVSEHSGKKIYPEVEGNPRRKGTWGNKSFAIVMRNPGIVYEDYITKGGRVNDLNWDLSRNFCSTK